MSTSYGNPPTLVGGGCQRFTFYLFTKHLLSGKTVPVLTSFLFVLLNSHLKTLLEEVQHDTSLRASYKEKLNTIKGLGYSNFIAPKIEHVVSEWE